MTIFREVTICRSKEENGNLRIVIWDWDYEPSANRTIIDILEWAWPTGSASEFDKLQRDVARHIARYTSVADFNDDEVSISDYTNSDFDFGRAKKFETKFLKALQMDMIVR